MTVFNQFGRVLPDDARTYKELLHAIIPHVRELGFEYDRMSGDGKEHLEAIGRVLRWVADGGSDGGLNFDEWETHDE